MFLHIYFYIKVRSTYEYVVDRGWSGKDNWMRAQFWKRWVVFANLEDVSSL